MLIVQQQVQVLLIQPLIAGGLLPHTVQMSLFSTCWFVTLLVLQALRHSLLLSTA